MVGWIKAGALGLEECLRAGGVIMAPLAVLCLVMWFLIVDRALFFRRMGRGDMGPQRAWEHIQGDIYPGPGRHGGAVALLVAEFLSLRCGDRAMDGWIMDEKIREISRRLTDRLALIGVLAAIAPLLGLLGTITGMMATFDVLAVFGTGNAKAMARGISEALITTQTGLLIAIPGLYMKGFLDQRARKIQQSVAAAGHHLRQRFWLDGP